MQPCKDFYVNQHNSTNWKIRAGMSDIETMMLDQNTTSLGWTGHQKLAWRAILQDLQLGKATNNGDVVCLSWHVSRWATFDREFTALRLWLLCGLYQDGPYLPEIIEEELHWLWMWFIVYYTFHMLFSAGSTRKLKDTVVPFTSLRP